MEAHGGSWKVKEGARAGMEPTERAEAKETSDEVGEIFTSDEVGEIFTSDEVGERVRVLGASDAEALGFLACRREEDTAPATAPAT